MHAFIHIEKAAGTTLIHILRNAFFMQYMDVRPISPDGKGLFTAADLKTYKKINPLLKCVGGHSVSPCANLEEVCNNISYFTILRDPIKRYLSHYEYLNNSLKLNIEFEQYINDESLCDLQCRRLSNSRSSNLAINQITDKKILVGLTEKLDLFLHSLQESIMPYRIPVIYRNVNIGNRRKKDYLLSKYYETITKNNAEDIKLYNYCHDIILPSHPGFCETHFPTPTRLTKPHSKIDFRLYVDYLIRKLYYKPITGVMRVANGMSYSGYH